MLCILESFGAILSLLDTLAAGGLRFALRGALEEECARGGFGEGVVPSPGVGT
jgi:hypothetical protein